MHSHKVKSMSERSLDVSSTPLYRLRHYIDNAIRFRRLLVRPSININIVNTRQRRNEVAPPLSLKLSGIVYGLLHASHLLICWSYMFQMMVSIWNTPKQRSQISKIVHSNCDTLQNNCPVNVFATIVCDLLEGRTWKTQIHPYRPSYVMRLQVGGSKQDRLENEMHLWIRLGMKLHAFSACCSCTYFVRATHSNLRCNARTCEMHEAFAKNISDIHIAFNAEG